MKKIPLTLICLIVVSSLVVACLGAYLKYEVLEPNGLMEEENIMAVPFLLLADHGTQYTLEYLQLQSEEPVLSETVPPTEVPPEPPTQPPTQPPTEPPTELPTEPPVLEVDESWFDDVLFIGDSRTVGLRDYARIGNAEYFCTVGMTVFSAKDTWAMDKNFGYTTLETLLGQRTYGKIYIGLGLNDCGYNHETIVSSYQSLLEMVREKQPDAVVILQGIMAVTEDKSDSVWYFGMDNLNAINDQIKTMSDGDMVRYIDVNEWIADEEGFLPVELSAGDGCHLTVDAYNEWARWIQDTAGDLRIP